MKTLIKASLLLAVSALLPGSSQAAAQWNWELLAEGGASAPERRGLGTLIYDPPGERLILFGGLGSSGNLNDTWEFLLGSRTWRRLQTTGTPPGPRRGHNAVYDPAGRQMVVWAGQQGGLFFNDVWTLNLQTLEWRDVSPPARPAARYGSASVFDPGTRRLVQFAGFTSEAGRFQDTQAFDLDDLAWTDLTPAGTKPEVRCLHTAALEPNSGRMIVYGGQRFGPLGDLWTFNLQAREWTQVTFSQGPSARFFATSFVDNSGNFLVFGGSTSGGNAQDTWSFNLDQKSWTKVDTSSAPSPRHSMMGAYLPDQNQFVIFGGNSNELLNDVWVLSQPQALDVHLYFPQFAEGQGYQSPVTLINPLPDRGIRGEIRVRDAQGQPLSLSLNGSAAAQSHQFLIPAQGSSTISLRGAGGLLTGSVLVSADGPLGGLLRFLQPSLGIAGVTPAASSTRFVLPVSRSQAGGFNSGVAITSIDSALSLTLILRNQQGLEVAQGRVVQELTAGGHLARFIDELFPQADTREFEGTLTILAEGGQAAAVAIQIGALPGQFTVLPVLVLP